ncbi:MAG: acyltransferase 3 [Acidimicrobiales bacterium]|nr:acyltransferase 3 [Acidimicrobiales bacterium]
MTATRSAARHIPALDGVRGAAVAAVLLYHQGFGWAAGGYLGVSSFFTLSGFLIGGLLVDERSRDGRIDLPGFWERRVRRLLPAAAICLLATAALVRSGALQGGRMPGDLVAATLYSANWRFASLGHGYADLFSRPSPVLHFWSLAIEEQFYVLLPLLVVALGRGRSRVRGRLAVVTAVGCVASFALAAATGAHGGESGIAYYGTHTRVGELLVGVLLALGVRTPAFQRWTTPRVGRAALAAVSGAALGGLVWLWHTVPIGGPFLFRGGTAANALLTVLVILGCLRSVGAGALLAVAPLRALGRVSYGVYVYHWPVFLWLTADRAGVHGWALFALRVAMTAAVAVPSYLFVEQPVRRRVAAPRRLVLGSATAAVVAVAVVALVFVHPGSQQTQVLDLSAGPGLLGRQPGGATQSAVSQPTKPRHAGAAYVSTLTIGDSLPYSMLPGVKDWNLHHPDRRIGEDAFIQFGCPLSGPGSLRIDGTEKGLFPECNTFLEGAATALGRVHPRVAVVAIGLSDLADRRFDGSRRWTHIGEPRFDQRLTERLHKLADILTFSGVKVVWLTFPSLHIVPPNGDASTLVLNDPPRVARLNELIRATVAGRAGWTLLDVAAWAQQPHGGLSPGDLRPDGVHFGRDGGVIAGRWLAEQVRRAAGAR